MYIAERMGVVEAVSVVAGMGGKVASRGARGSTLFRQERGSYCG